MKTSAIKFMTVVMGIILVSFTTSYATAGSDKLIFLGDYYHKMKPGAKGQASLNSFFAI